jgi:3-oxoacyl-[acyl-carrier-protein] synthase II
VVVTGVGLLCALGDSAEQVHQALCEGRTGLRAAGQESGEAAGSAVGELGDLDLRRYLGDGNLRPLDRSSRLAAAAAALALAHAGWTADDIARAEVGLVLGTMFGSLRTITRFDRRAVLDGPVYAKPMDFANTVINAAAGQTAIWHGLRGVNATVSAGLVSGLQALATGADIIRAGGAEALLAGGAEELCPEILLAFRRAGLLCPGNGEQPTGPQPLHRKRGGFALAEGAALLLLEERGAAVRRGARILAELVGQGAGFDPTRGADAASAAGSVARAVRAALEAARVEPRQIEVVSLSANGSTAADAREAEGLQAAVDGRLRHLPATSIKAALGETPGATGALQAILLTEAMRAGSLPGITGLDELDPGLPALAVSTRARPLEARRGLVVSHGPDGRSAALVIEAGPRP